MSWRKVALLAACGILSQECLGATAVDVEDDDDDDLLADVYDDERLEAEENAKWIKSLGEEDFEKYILEKNWVVVKFTQKWCPHCQVLAKEFVKSAKALEEKKIHFADVGQKTKLSFEKNEILFKFIYILIIFNIFLWKG